jgi:hypothetical protein
MLNYSTTIAATKTVGEIQQLLAKKGVRKIVVDYDKDTNPIALTFALDWNGIPTFYALPCRWEGVQKALARNPKIRPSGRTKEQALRVAWRIIKDWTEAQLAIIEAELAELPEVFLPYAITRDKGTFYAYTSSRRDQFLLPTGE